MLSKDDFTRVYNKACNELTSMVPNPADTDKYFDAYKAGVSRNGDDCRMSFVKQEDNTVRVNFEFGGPEA